jgi:hypothetical protein
VLVAYEVALALDVFVVRHSTTAPRGGRGAATPEPFRAAGNWYWTSPIPATMKCASFSQGPGARSLGARWAQSMSAMI